MKTKIFFLASFFAFSFFSTFSFAEYKIELNLSEKKVYIVSGEQNISVDNVDQYFSGSLVNSGSESSSGSQNTGSQILPAFSGSVYQELGTWTELEKAIYWMYTNGLTMYTTTTSYRPNDLLTREEAAKLMWQLFEVLRFEQTNKWLNCLFIDSATFDPSLSAYIQKVCTRWIFRGNDKTQEYMPHDNLTKWQILAVLMRMLEGKMSDETLNPWWIEYYVKAKNLWLTTETTLGNFDLPITREGAALLIYRFKNIIVNQEDQASSYVQQLLDRLNEFSKWSSYETTIDDLLKQRLAIYGSGSSNLPSWSWSTSGSGSSSGSGLDLDLIVGDTSLADDPEFNEAIHWMYDVGITKYGTVDTYLPFQTITRGQVAKMLDSFASVTNLTTIRNHSTCTFSDVASNSEFKSAITNVCQYGVMMWTNGKFLPNQVVTKAEFIAMLIRLVEGKSLDENVSPRWMNYYKKAIELSLISAQDTVTFSQPITRYEVAIFLYRLKVRLTMFNNLNDTKLPDEIVKTIEDTTWSGDSKQSGKIYVDILSLNNAAFTNWYVEVFWERYKVKKSTTNSYNVGANSFVWYGDLIDLEKEQYVGTITFIMTNGALTEGAIRFSSTKTSYYISKDPITTTYYHLNQL